MGVPKFFRWLSERYPLINQPIHCPPNEDTKKAHGYPVDVPSDDEDENVEEQTSSRRGKSTTSSSPPANFKRDHRKNTK